MQNSRFVSCPASSLHLGHRYPEALDFFGHNPSDPMALATELSRLGEVRVQQAPPASLGTSPSPSPLPQPGSGKLAWVEDPHRTLHIQR